MSSTRSAKLRWRVSLDHGAYEATTSTSSSPDGRYVAVNAHAEPLRLLSADTGLDVAGFERGRPIAYSIHAWSPTSARLYVRCPGVPAAVIDVPSGVARPIQEVSDRGYEYDGRVAWSSDGETLVVAYGGRVGATVAATGNLAWSYESRNEFRRVWFAPDGRVVAAELDSLSFFDPRDGSIVATRSPAIAEFARESPDGATFAARPLDGSDRVVIYDLSGAERASFSGEFVAFSSNGKFVVLARDGFYEIGDVATGRVERIGVRAGRTDDVRRGETNPRTIVATIPFAVPNFESPFDGYFFVDGPSILLQFAFADVSSDGSALLLGTLGDALEIVRPGRPTIEAWRLRPPFGGTFVGDGAAFLARSYEYVELWDAVPNADRVAALFESGIGARIPDELRAGTLAFLERST